MHEFDLKTFLVTSKTCIYFFMCLKRCVYVEDHCGVDTLFYFEHLHNLCKAHTCTDNSNIVTAMADVKLRIKCAINLFFISIFSATLRP